MSEAETIMKTVKSFTGRMSKKFYEAELQMVEYCLRTGYKEFVVCGSKARHLYFNVDENRKVSMS